jgi:hypothetical protein
MAWSDPDLQAGCAPDENSYAWSIWLPTESNYDMEFSWNSNFSSAWDVTFPGNGFHLFTTNRGGSVLYVRFASDHGAGDSAAVDSELCEPEETPTPTPSPTPSPTPEGSQAGETGTPTPSPTPEGSQAGATGTPAASLPNTALGASGAGGTLATILFGFVLLASLGSLAYANVRAARH